MSPQPTVFLGRHGIEEGVTARLARIRENLYADVGLTKRWGGVGVEYEWLDGVSGLFAGVGYDIKSKNVESRVGVTINL